MLWDRRAALGGVLAVVQADAQNVRRDNRGQQHVDRQQVLRDQVRAEQIAVDPQGGVVITSLP
jgi:hypothetical protein